MTVEVLWESEVESELATHAAEIRLRGKRVVEDVIEIGRRLAIARELVKHGEWRPWLKREFDWSEDTAERFIHVAKMQNEIPQIAELTASMLAHRGRLLVTAGPRSVPSTCWPRPARRMRPARRSSSGPRRARR